MNSEHPIGEVAPYDDAGWKGTDLDAILAKDERPGTESDENHVQTKCVVGGILGIMLAGTSYPFIVTVLLTTYWAVTDSNMAYNDASEALQAIGFITILGGAFGGIISTVTGLLGILIVLVVNRSMGNPLNGRAAAISAGSLAGYLPFAFFVPNFDDSIQEIFASALLGPVLAMSLGAFGANWSSKSHSGVDDLIELRPKYRLSIRHMMIATAWIAVLFAIANVPGCQRFLPVVAAWLGLQAAMLFSIRLYRKLRKPSDKTRHRKSIETNKPKSK